MAVFKSYNPYQVLNIPVVNVWTAKWSTAPKSERVSIITNINPAIKAGRARGKEIFENIPIWPNPNSLPDSFIELDWFKKALLVTKYTYGYNVNEKTIIAPVIFLTFGKKTKSLFKLNKYH